MTEERCKSFAKERSPGPAAYYPSSSSLQSTRKYNFGKRLSDPYNDGLVIVAGTTKKVGPGRYIPENVKNAGLKPTPSKYSFGKQRRLPK
jgi:hypothetical protein